MLAGLDNLIENNKTERYFESNKNWCLYLELGFKRFYL